MVTGPAYLGHFPHDDVAVEWLWRGVSVTHRTLRRRPLIDVAHGVMGGSVAADVVGGGAMSGERIGLVDEPASWPS